MGTTLCCFTPHKVNFEAIEVSSEFFDILKLQKQKQFSYFLKMKLIKYLT